MAPLRWDSASLIEGPGSAQSLAFIGDIVNYDVIADLVGGSIEDAAGIETRELVDKALPVKISTQHEGIDLNPALSAALHFFESLVNDAAVQ